MSWQSDPDLNALRVYVLDLEKRLAKLEAPPEKRYRDVTAECEFVAETNDFKPSIDHVTSQGHRSIAVIMEQAGYRLRKVKFWCKGEEHAKETAFIIEKEEP